MTRTIASLLVVSMLALRAVAGEAAVSDKDIQEKCDAYMQARMKYSGTKFSGSVMLARDGKPLYTKGFGLANIEHSVPNTPQTKFRLASVSKQFTATGIMILEHEGKLKLDDPISKHVPSVPEAWGAVTLHQLLSHTGGVPENLRPALFKGLWPQPADKDKLFEHIKKLPLDFKPGEKWSYSNTGYALLGLTIEKVGGMPYEEFLRQRIFEPLGMKDTGVDNRRLVLKNRASGYGMSKNDYVQCQYIDLSQVFSAGSMYSTVEDLLKWDNGLYSGKLLPPKSLERMWTPVKDNYGYGWLVLTRFGRKSIAHDGGLPGFVTTIVRFPEQKLFVSALCNLEGSAVHRVARDLTAIALGEPYDMPVDRTEAKLDAKLFDIFVGEYEVRPLRVVKFPAVGDFPVGSAQVLKITKAGEELFAQMTGQGRFRLIPESETAFFARAEEATVVFAKDGKGAITDLTMHQNGRDVKAKRLPPKVDASKTTTGSGKSEAGSKK